MTTLQIISLICGMLGMGGIISGIVSRQFSKMDKKLEKRNEDSVNETLMIFRGIRTIGDLSHATAEAMKTGTCNGHVSHALEEYEKYKDDLQEFVETEAAKKNHSENN